MTARGGDLETFLSDYHVYARPRGLFMERTGAEARLVRSPTGPVFVTPKSSGRPDYMGCLRAAPHGVPLVMDAKECSQDRWPFAWLKPHQAEFFTSWERTGGVALIYLRIQGADYLLFWRDIKDRWEDACATGSLQAANRISRPMRGTKSLTLAELPSIGRRVGPGGWLDVLLPIPGPL